MLQRQVESTDRQIDRLVYELYGLTRDCGTVVPAVRECRCTDYTDLEERLAP